MLCLGFFASAPISTSALTTQERTTLIIQLVQKVFEINQKIVALGGTAINIPPGLAALAQGSGGSAGAAACAIERTLSLGMRGDDVKCLQTYLIAQNLLAPDSATGYFGRLTQAAVKKFQQAHNPEPVGSIGPRTRGVVNALLASQAHTSATSTPPTSQPSVTPPISYGGGGGGGTPPPIPPPPPSPDTTPPAVSITAPTASSTVSGVIAVAVNASDNVAVASVQFMLDGANLGAEATVPPYSASWNSTSSTNGTHTIQAIARDAAGNKATSTIIAIAANLQVRNITATPILRADCSQVGGGCGTFLVPSGTTTRPYGYAYAPADIDYGGAHHLFFCSTGSKNNNFDDTRYINDRDKVLKIVLSPLGYRGSGSDMAGCDPSVALFKGYFYLFYGSSLTINPAEPDHTKWVFINVIHVARSAAIEGPYQILDQDGTWKTTTDTPKHIIPPHVISLDRTQKKGYIGASWPSVVVRGDTLLLWYEDDTDEPVPGPATRHYYYLTSTDPASWNTATEVKTDIRDFVHSGEVKFDPQSNLFVMFNVNGANAHTSQLSMRYSIDGVHWSAASTVSDLPPYSHNVGVESDETGALPSGVFRFNYGAPVGLKNDMSWGYWNLYTGYLSRI